MTIREAAFWVGLELSMIALYFLFEGVNRSRFFLALSFLLVGIAGVVYSVVKAEYPNANLPSIPAWAWGPLAILALGAFGREIYSENRHIAPPPDTYAPLLQVNHSLQLLPIGLSPRSKTRILTISEFFKADLQTIENETDYEQNWPRKGPIVPQKWYTCLSCRIMARSMCLT